MFRRTRLTATAAVCAIALALGACGGGGDSGPGPSAGAAGEPVAGGEGRLLLLAEPRTLDPAILGNGYATLAVLGNALYGTLMTGKDDGRVEYKMAESFETTDEGRTFTLTLRDGLLFSDGTPLNAEAVKFNWDRLKEPATRAVNLAEASDIASTEVVDDVTLKVTLVNPVPAFAQSVVTSTLNWIGSPAALQKGAQAFDAAPIGAGPFVLESWTRQADLKLVRNPRYWDAPKPYLERLTMRTATETNQRYNTVLTGGADLAIESSPVNLDKAEQAGLATDVMDLSGGLFLAMNTRRAPFDDIRARRAVAAALDLEAVNLAVYNGTGRPADLLFADSSPFHTSTTLHKTDKALAQKLFDELAADGKPLSFTFTSAPSAENRTIAENIQAQLGAFKNVRVEVKVAEITEYVALRRTHEFDAAVSSAFFQDPEPRLWTTFNGKSAANLPGIDDPKLNDALADARAATTEDERRTAYAVFEKALVDLMPVVFLARAEPGVIAGKGVGGFVQYGLGSLLPEEIWISR
ncbi:ABC transporter substrate-binding protein [Parafrankia sp. FMc2]|uniref:ABC transporter substrate-binding protein n=1 Tax=Parafrankia sp. FMc2 TaxID=3233196 RepID=UPI0034D4D058